MLCAHLFSYFTVSQQEIHKNARLTVTVLVAVFNKESTEI